MGCLRIFFILVVVSASTYAVVMRDGRANQNQCQELRCNHAAGIADRLSKLSLLPEFVTQTLMLLEDLMKEMEGELHRSATYLMDQMEPTCEHTFKVIEDILKKKKKRSGRQHAELGMGIEPLGSEGQTAEETTESYYKEDEQKIHFNKYDRPNSRDDSSWLGVNKEGQNWSESGYNRQDPHEYGGSQEKWSPVTDNTETHWRPATEKNHWSQTGEDTSWSQSHTDTHGTEGQYPEYQKEYPSQGSEPPYFDQLAETKPARSKKKYGRNDKSGSWSKSDLASGIDPLNSEASKPLCRGHDKRSPFWVPGIDQWCRQNCKAGYCPVTHCIC